MSDMSDTTDTPRNEGCVAADPTVGKSHDTTDTTDTTSDLRRTHDRPYTSGRHDVSAVPVVSARQDSATPPSRPEPVALDADGCTNHHTNGVQPTNQDGSAIGQVSRGQYETAPSPVADATAGPIPATWDPRQRTAIALDAAGTPVDEICEACPTESGRPMPRSTLAAWRRLPGWADAVAAQRGALAREADGLRVAVRHQALSAARRMLAQSSPSEALVRAVLAATTPDGAERDARARAAVLRRLPPKLRAQVALHLDDADAAAVEAMTDEELDAALAATERTR